MADLPVGIWAPEWRYASSFRRPTSFTRDATCRAVRGVCSAGFTTTVFPQLSAGPIFQMSMTRGKFH